MIEPQLSKAGMREAFGWTRGELDLFLAERPTLPIAGRSPHGRVRWLESQVRAFIAAEATEAGRRAAS
jgi:hypothetical protein